MPTGLGSGGLGGAIDLSSRVNEGRGGGEQGRGSCNSAMSVC